MKVTLLGTGDSAGIPQIGCNCETCTIHRSENRERTRFSVLVEVGDTRILIDASPDLRHQLLRERIDGVDAIVLTHAHYDHYAGLGSLYRVVWEELPVYGVHDVLEYVVEERYSYLSLLRPVEVDPYETFRVGGAEIELVPVHHPSVQAFGVILWKDNSKLVITGDTSRDIPDRSFEEFLEPDLLVADAFIPEEGDFPGFVEQRISEDRLNFADKHMTYKGAQDLADAVNAKKMTFVHLSHYYREEHSVLGRDGDTYNI